MNEADKELEEKLAEVRRGYIERLPERLHEIHEELKKTQKGEVAAAQTLHRQIHSLTGSLGTFGFDELSGLARLIERELKAIVDEELALEPAVLAKIEANISRLGSGIQSLPGNDGTLVSAAPPQRDRPPLVFVLDSVSGSGRALADQIASFGYETRAYADSEALTQALLSERPQIIIAHLPGDASTHSAYMDDLNRIRSRWGQAAPPIVFVSDHSGLPTRLAAVRNGAAGFFTTPVAINDLMDRLDNITFKAHAVPYRVLIVDDDSDQGQHHALVLRNVGIEARHLANPMSLLTAIDEFKPELILMDLYMPECTGIELAKTIRQNNAYLGIPIIFLSSETSAGVQFDALSQGGDGFLTKPINDQDLINSVIVRSERTRAISSHLARDSLTGLLNHSTSKDMIGTEFQRARRTGNPLSCVMLDLDHFKRINDTYGHMTGDQVIATLSRVLQQRLRETDIVGRYGGEEFIILMPNTGADSAYRVVDEMRWRFGELTHHTGRQEFHVTLSAGISESTHFERANDMLNAADEALYRAKSDGRNQVRVAAGASGTSTPG